MKRIILLSILASEGIAAVAGGLSLVLAPDGSILHMPVEKLHGVFTNFLIPGIVLTTMGILTISAFFAVLLKSKIDWLFAGIALIGFTCWFLVEISIIREVHILHVIWGIPILVGIWATLPLVPKDKLFKN